MSQDQENQGTEPEDEEARSLYELYAHSDDAMREAMKPLFALMGLPVPFTLPQPPEDVTPEMGVAALRMLVRQSQALARENMRVMLGIQKIDPLLGHKMLLDAHFAQGRYQEILQEIIADLNQRR